MLEIRKEQMEVFEKDMRRRIKQRTMMDLRRERPAEFEKRGEEHFRELIEVAEGRIDQFDGDLYKDLHRYILLMLDLGLNFHTDEVWAAEVFNDDEVPGVSKLDVLEIYAAD